MIVVYRSPHGRQIKSARWMPWPGTAKKDATNLRKASGRRFVACDPEMSEWGNPAVLNCNPRGNAREKRTPGSETSQYREEKRTIRVAFCPDEFFGRIERGSRDTLSSGERKGNSPNPAHFQCVGGCKVRRSLRREGVTNRLYSGSRWEAVPQRVMAPYAK